MSGPNLRWLPEDADPRELANLTADDDGDAALLADFARLTDAALRQKQDVERGRFIAETTLVVKRALAAGYRPRSFFLAEKHLPDLEEELAGWPDIPVFVGSERALERIAGFHLHRGALASFWRKPLPSVGELASQASGRSRVAILDGLVDHTNVGASFRSAAAMGVDAVLVTPDCADPLYRRAIRVSMGTVFQVPWTRIAAWPSGVEELQAEGYVVAGMTLGEGSITLDELVAQDHDRLALVFGNEGHGLSAATEAALDRRVIIPMMAGVDSLNVAASSAVAFYATR